LPDDVARHGVHDVPRRSHRSNPFHVVPHVTLENSGYQYFSDAFDDARVHDAGIGDENPVLGVQSSQLGDEVVDATTLEQGFPCRLEQEVYRHLAFPPR